MIYATISTNRPVINVLHELFRAIILQGGRCVNMHGSCRYGMNEEQGTQEKHCLVGWLLPSDNKQLMDEGGVLNCLIDNLELDPSEYSRAIKTLGPNESFIKENSDVLRSAQQVHDFVGLKQIDEMVKGLLDSLKDNDEADLHELKRLITIWLKVGKGSGYELTAGESAFVKGEPTLSLDLLTRDGFIAFINQSDPALTIDHTGANGWTRCAVGQYLEYELGGLPDSMWRVNPNSFLTEYSAIETALSQKDRAEAIASTYGALQEYIKDPDVFLTDSEKLAKLAKAAEVPVEPEDTKEPLLLEHAPLSPEGFLSFVAQQPAGRAIRHFGGWDNCVVGEYIASTGRNVSEETKQYTCGENNPCVVAGSRLHILLRDGSRATKMVPTYGALQTWLVS